MVVVAQSACLIKAIVQRRITMMQRRDREQEQARLAGTEVGNDQRNLQQFAEDVEN